jgi:uncharacterized membrane protein YdjX (TVP38/TMEM64 family)
MNATAETLPTTRFFGTVLNPTVFVRAGQAALLLALPPAAWLARQPLSALWNLLKDREALLALARGLGPWGPVALMLAIGLQVTFAVLPGHVMMLAGGYLYGFVPGVLITWVSTVAASQVNFMLARRYGLPLVYRLCPRALVDRWEGVVKDKGFFFFLLTLVLPIFPSDLMCYLAGFSKLTPRRYALVNMLGHLPCALGMSLVGSGLLVVNLSPLGWVLLVGLCVGALVLWGRYGKALEQHFFPVIESEA